MEGVEEVHCFDCLLLLAPSLPVVVSCFRCPQVVGVVDWMPHSSSCPILDFSCESLLVSNDTGYLVCYSFLFIIVFVLINLSL